MLLVLAAAPGCEELDARRKIQKAGKLYAEGRFAQAAEVYEEALKLAPQLAIGHHNAGLTYSKLFKPGDESPENVEIANRANEHFAIYLESEPEDPAIIGLMTRIWMDSGQYDKALVFWEGQLSKNPDDPDVLEILAGINRQAGNWEKAVEWHYKQADAVHGVQNKVDTLLLIAKLIWHKLYRQQPVGYQRLQIADTGIQALQKALSLKPPDEMSMQLHAYLSSIFQFRALAHPGSWAREVDRASMRYHAHQRKVLNEAVQKQQKQEEEKQKPDAAEKQKPETGLLEPRLPVATRSG